MGQAGDETHTERSRGGRRREIEDAADNPQAFGPSASNATRGRRRDFEHGPPMEAASHSEYTGSAKRAWHGPGKPHGEKRGLVADWRGLCVAWSAVRRELLRPSSRWAAGYWRFRRWRNRWNHFTRRRLRPVRRRWCRILWRHLRFIWRERGRWCLWLRRSNGSPPTPEHACVLPFAARFWASVLRRRDLRQPALPVRRSYDVLHRLPVHTRGERPLLPRGRPGHGRRMLVRRVLHRLGLRSENALPLP